MSLVTLAGAFLRFWELGAQSLWLDELFSVALARRDLGAIISGTLQDTQPPLYYLLLHLALGLGQDEVAARFISVLFSALTIPLVYLVAWEFYHSRAAALLAAILVAVSPFQIAYAQEARMYALLVFWQLAAILFFYRAAVRGGRSDWILFALAQAVALYCHSLAVLSLVAVDAWWLLDRGRRAQWRAFGASHVLVGVIFLPWAAALAGQAERVLSGFWAAQSTLLNLSRTFYVLEFNRALPTLLVPVGLLVVLLLFGLGLYVALRALIVRDAPTEDRPALALAICLTTLPPISLLALSLIRPIYIERVVIISSVGLCLVWAWVWTKRPKMIDRLLILSGSILLVLALGNYYAHPELQKPPMREAAQMLSLRVQTGDVILHTSDWTALAFSYYLPGIPQHYLAGDPDYVHPTTRGNSGRIAGLVPEDASSVVRGQNRIWVVAALDHNEAYQQERVAEFDSLYARAGEWEVERVYLLLYEPRAPGY